MENINLDNLNLESEKTKFSDINKFTESVKSHAKDMISKASKITSNIANSEVVSTIMPSSKPSNTINNELKSQVMPNVNTNTEVSPTKEHSNTMPMNNGNTVTSPATKNNSVMNSTAGNDVVSKANTMHSEVTNNYVMNDMQTKAMDNIKSEVENHSMSNSNNNGSGVSPSNRYGCNPSPFPKHTPIGMAYVPMQSWQKIYPEAVALQRGTLFQELDLPFIGEEAVPNDRKR